MIVVCVPDDAASDPRAEYRQAGIPWHGSDLSQGHRLRQTIDLDEDTERLPPDDLAADRNPER